MSAALSTLTFLSDFGLAGEGVGVVKSVLRCGAPQLQVIDLTHEVSPFDVRQASVLLARAVPHLAPGIVMAMVEPGAAERALAVEVGGGESVLLGPDNGILAPAVAMVGGADRAVELSADPDLAGSGSGGTFAARDVYAPAACRLANGALIESLGPMIDPQGLRPAMWPFSTWQGDRLDAEVLLVDRFGNVHLNVASEQLRPGHQRYRVRIGGATSLAVRAGTFADLPPGACGLIIDEVGMAMLAEPNASLADRFGTTAGAEVVLTPLDDELAGEGPIASAAPVELRRP